MRGVERADNSLIVEMSHPRRVVMSFYLSIISLQGLSKAERVRVDKLRIFIDDTARKECGPTLARVSALIQ